MPKKSAKAHTFNSALKVDKETYIDKENGDYGVFGDNSGFCYYLSPSKAVATIHQDRLNSTLKGNQ